LAKRPLDTSPQLKGQNNIRLHRSVHYNSGPDFGIEVRSPQHSGLHLHRMSSSHFDPCRKFGQDRSLPCTLVTRRCVIQWNLAHHVFEGQTHSQDEFWTVARHKGFPVLFSRLWGFSARPQQKPAICITNVCRKAARSFHPLPRQDKLSLTIGAHNELLALTLKSYGSWFNTDDAGS
jgi:hypothetical protein